LVVSQMWVSISFSNVFNKKEERFIGWKSLGEKYGLADLWVGRDVLSALCSWALKNKSGPVDLKGLKELIAHLMRSRFQILSTL